MRKSSETRHVALYLRVSSRSQREALKNQEPELQRYVDGQDEPVKWYRDTFSGKTMERPGFDKLLADVRAGKVSKIVVWRLDRLGRTAVGLLNLLSELRALKVGFQSLRDGFDLDTAAGRMVFGILASVAEYETEVRRERQAAGIDRALEDVRQGKREHWGGRKPGTRIKVTVEKEKLIRKLAVQETPISTIARNLGLTRRTVYKVLARQPAKV